MSLTNIDRLYSVLHIAGREYRVRYSLNALLCLEKMYKPLSEILKEDSKFWGIETILQLTRAALCSCPWNRKAVDRRDFEHVFPTLSELGEIVTAADLPLMRIELIAAIVDAMPNANENAETPSENASAFHEGHQRAMFVDVMGRSEREYWDSTNREITQKIDCYLEVTGEKPAPVRVQRYGEMRQGMESI